jgi:putative endonuclease
MYVVRCSDNSLYAGITTNVKRRVREHNASKKRGAKYTRARRPVHLVFSQECKSRAEAMVSEIGFKKMRKKDKEDFILERTKDDRREGKGA